MNVGQSIAVIFLATLLCACGGGDGVDATGRSNAPDTHGIVSSVAGTGSAGLSNLRSSVYAPTAIAIDRDGVMYIAVTGNHVIRKRAVNGTFSTLAGTVVENNAQFTGVPGFADGQGDLASFSSPRGIAVDDSGNVYVADSGNHRIRKISPTGTVTTLAGSGATGSQDNGDLAAATFDDPRGIAVDGSGSTVYVSDYSGNVIRKITSAGVVTLAGRAGVSGGSDGAGTAATFTHPWGVALSVSGSLYVADTGDHWTSNHLIRKIDVSSGVVSTLAGIPGVFGKLDGAGTSASFHAPSGVAVDSKEVVYVADTGNSLIRKISVTGEVSTLAGSGAIGNDDKPAGADKEASFSSPRGIAVDIHGDVYVADTENHLIRKINK